MFEPTCFDMTSARLGSSDYFFQFIVVAFLQNTTIGYSSESVCVFLCLKFLCFRVPVFLQDN